MNTFSLAREHPPKDGLTISTGAGFTSVHGVTYFSLGKNTDISAEKYSSPIMLIGSYGQGEVVFGNDSNAPRKSIASGEFTALRPNSLFGTAAKNDGFIYTEVMVKGDIIMNENVKTGEVFALKDLLDFEKGSIVNMDVARSSTMKFVVMAFDAGTGLSPHSAPGDALIFALDGEGIIGYEGKEHKIKAGENFRFAKGGLHSVKAVTPFKMALLLTLE